MRPLWGQREHAFPSVPSVPVVLDVPLSAETGTDDVLIAGTGEARLEYVDPDGNTWAVTWDVVER